MTETTDIAKDQEVAEDFHHWLDGIDCALVFYGSVPSSSLFLGYNAAYIEKQGKPVVMAVVPRTHSAGVRGVKARCVPGLRIVQYMPRVLDIFGHCDVETMKQNMGDTTGPFVNELIAGLTAPLTQEERHPTPASRDLATWQLSPEQPRRFKPQFLPERVGPTALPSPFPTREAVDEMLQGTDYPADYVVAKIPPMMGQATVEKIAVNAVMAGCLPTYLPVLIAAVQGAMDPKSIWKAGVVPSPPGDLC